MNRFLISFAFVFAPLAANAHTAAPVDAFLNSVAVNIHIHQAGGLFAYYEPMLTYTGIRVVRDYAWQYKDVLAIRSRIHSSTYDGPKMILLSQGTTAAQMVQFAKALAAQEALVAFEGWNEPNNGTQQCLDDSGQWGGRSDWTPVAICQAALYAAVRADASFNDYPVLGPSEAGGQVPNVGLQYPTIPRPAPQDVTRPAGTRYWDVANLHNYVQGVGDCGKKVRDNQAWKATDPTLNDCWDGYHGNISLSWAHRYTGPTGTPWATTETSWGTCGSNPVSEAKQASLALNVFLDSFKRGAPFTVWYQMVDAEGGDDNCQGLYTKDHKPKRAATAIHNLTTILADSRGGNRGSAVLPNGKAAGQLSYSIPQEHRLDATVHDQLLRKSDGTFWLAVWSELASGGQSVEVNFDSPHKLSVYDPVEGSEAGDTVSAASLTLTLSDHPLIVQVRDRP